MICCAVTWEFVHYWHRYLVTYSVSLSDIMHFLEFYSININCIHVVGSMLLCWFCMAIIYILMQNEICICLLITECCNLVTGLLLQQKQTTDPSIVNVHLNGSVNYTVISYKILTHWRLWTEENWIRDLISLLLMHNTVTSMRSSYISKIQDPNSLTWLLWFYRSGFWILGCALC